MSLQAYSNDDTAYFWLDLPQHVLGSIYYVTIEASGKSAICTLTTPTQHCSLDLSSAAGGYLFSPGAPLDLIWVYTGSNPDSFLIDVWPCEDAPEESRYGIGLGGIASSHEIPASVTQGFTVCDTIKVDIVADHFGKVHGELASAGSRCVVVPARTETWFIRD